ncbi:MAG: hypothetical protein JSU86_11385 [Phycisphaerales bacterium]|nr:MAG: hypothetical protein JSU86_11385 [Phycisphaerales bacterium]
MCEGWQEGLLGPGSPDWFALEGEQAAVAVKVGYGRTTWRVVLPGCTVFAKVLDNARFLDRLKRRVIGDAAQREWQISQEAGARGVPVVPYVALGSRHGPSPRTVLLSEAVAGGVSLLEAWERDVEWMGRPNRRTAGADLIPAVARLFAAAHERGFVHRDAHPNNILVRASPTGEVEAIFVDVHAARVLRRPVSPEHAMESLAQLDQYFQRRATRTERLRFLRSYLARHRSGGRGGGDRAMERTYIETLGRAAVSHADRLARQRDRRLGRGGKYFSKLSLAGGWKATVALQVERRHVFPEADVPNWSLADWDGFLGPLLPTLADVRATGATFDHNGLHLELRRSRGFTKRLIATVRGTGHRRFFERCHRLRHRDVPGELILGYVEHRRAGLVDATMLIRPKRDETRQFDVAAQPGGYRDAQDRDHSR